jgi:hypothetical protein
VSQVKRGYFLNESKTQLPKRQSEECCRTSAVILPKTRKMRVYVTSEIKDEFRLMCETKGVTQSEMIEKLIKRQLTSMVALLRIDVLVSFDGRC